MVRPGHLLTQHPGAVRQTQHPISWMRCLRPGGLEDLGACPGRTAAYRWQVGLEAGLPASVGAALLPGPEFKDALVFDEGGQKSVSVSFLSAHVCLWHLAPVPWGHLHPCPVPSFPEAPGVRFLGTRTTVPSFLFPREQWCCFAPW